MIDHELLLKMETRVNAGRKAVRWLWLTYVGLGSQFVLLGTVLGIEFVLLYRTFEAISGKNNEHWTPELMALTGATMVSAFHLLCKAKEDNPALRVINKLTPLLLVIYLLGLGLLMAGIIYIDASGLLLSTTTELVIGVLPEAATQVHWLDAIFENFANPVALGLFSLGIGGMAIVNLFVAHALLGGLDRGVSRVRDRKSEANRLEKEYDIVQDKLKRHRELRFDHADLELWTDSRLIHETALQINRLQRDGTADHRYYVKHRDIEPPPGLLSLPDHVDHKLIERELKKIDALDVKAITKIINNNTLLEG
jgi:hypothetical protein